MLEKINLLLNETKQFSANNKEDIENFRIKLLSKKGLIPQLFSEFKNIPPEQKKEIGQKLNELKFKVQLKIKQLNLELAESIEAKPIFDLTLPGDVSNLGTRHPVSIIRNEIIEIFSRLGFTISEGPEIEDDWHVLSVLNFPESQPARDMQDTFFIAKNPDILLRTQTSSVQVRVMENQIPPIRTISPGRVFRNESISARAHCIFHQVEGLYIDKNVSFADLKQTLVFF